MLKLRKSLATIRGLTEAAGQSTVTGTVFGRDEAGAYIEADYSALVSIVGDRYGIGPAAAAPQVGEITITGAFRHFPTADGPPQGQQDGVDIPDGDPALDILRVLARERAAEQALENFSNGW